MNRATVSKGWIILTLILILITIGTAGYMFFTGAEFIDSLYMTIITISTVGYKEIADLTTGGKLFTIGVILSGLGIVSYAMMQTASFLIDGGIKQIFRRRSMEKRIANLEQHIIICGAGQTGMSVIEQFRQSKEPFVVIEQDESQALELAEMEVPVICGDATSENVLIQAKISTAKGLVCCFGNDAGNVYTVLTARELNPELHIVARSIEKGSAAKLKRAGADNTISPNELGGARMAYMVLKPHVVSFLDLVTRIDNEVLDIGEVTIGEHAEIAGFLLKEAKIPQKTGLIIIAIREEKGKLRFNPGPHEKLAVNSSMLVLGKPAQIEKLRKMASAQE